MRVVVDLDDGLAIRVNNRYGRGISLNQGQSSIRISQSNVLKLVDAIVAVAMDNNANAQNGAPR